MREKRLDKKGVSPLIATVLLIAFAVALGAIVMNWGRGYVEDTQDFARESSENQLTCSSDVEMDFEVIFVNATDEDGPNVLTVTVRSDGGTDIYDLAAQVFTNESKGASVLIDDQFLDDLGVEGFEGEVDDDENVNLPVLPQFKFLTFNITPEDLGFENDLEELEAIDNLKLIPRIRASSAKRGADNIACAAQAVEIDRIEDEWQYEDQG
jgi:flagellin-like protein